MRLGGEEDLGRYRRRQRAREREGDDQRAPHLSETAPLHVLAGRENVNVDPAPTSLVTRIVPPCSPMNFRQRASPSPVPSCFAALAPTCLNSSNTASRSSGAMPTPVSLTDTSTAPLSSAAPTSIRPPSGVNLIAFDSRFKSTCRIFRSSPRIVPT